MAVKAIQYKRWCTENISPQSWIRIVLKSTDIIRSCGMTVKEVEEPTDTVELPDDVYQALNKALADLYDIQMQESIIKAG